MYQFCQGCRLKLDAISERDSTYRNGPAKCSNIPFREALPTITNVSSVECLESRVFSSNQIAIPQRNWSEVNLCRSLAGPLCPCLGPARSLPESFNPKGKMIDLWRLSSHTDVTTPRLRRCKKLAATRPASGSLRRCSIGKIGPRLSARTRWRWNAPSNRVVYSENTLVHYHGRSSNPAERTSYLQPPTFSERLYLPVTVGNLFSRVRRVW